MDLLIGRRFLGLNYFIDFILSHQTNQTIAKIEARNYWQLVEEYFEQAKSNLELKNYLLIVDASFNAAELCAKGFLI